VALRRSAWGVRDQAARRVPGQISVEREAARTGERACWAVVPHFAKCGTTGRVRFAPGPRGGVADVLVRVPWEAAMVGLDGVRVRADRASVVLPHFAKCERTTGAHEASRLALCYCSAATENESAQTDAPS